MFDYFKYLGDLCHLLSFVVLISNMREKKSCLGLSYRTQELYMIIFLIRYSDVFFIPQTNKWNLTLKFLFTGATLYVIYLMRYQKPICVSYEAIVDKFPHRITILPISLVLAFIFKDHSPIATSHPYYAFFYDYTVIIEAFAFLPQLYLMRKIEEIEIITGAFIFLLGSYRAIYILSWIWRLYEGYSHLNYLYIKLTFGTIQFLLFGDFLWRYIKSVKNKEKYVNVALPL